MPPAPKHCPEQQLCKILSAAAECIEESSLLDFTMSGIAKKAGMSMGSIYKHVHTKEDVLMALAQHGLDCLRQAFATIFNSPLSISEQLIALSLIDYSKVDPYPFTRHLEMLISNSALISRTSPQWQQKTGTSGCGIEEVMNMRFRTAIENGELTPEGDENAYLEQLHLGIWAINVGHIQVLLQIHSDQLAANLPRNKDIEEIFPLDANNPHIQNCLRLINSYQWRHPLTQDGIQRAIDVLLELEYR